MAPRRVRGATQGRVWTGSVEEIDVKSVVCLAKTREKRGGPNVTWPLKKTLLG